MNCSSDQNVKHITCAEFEQNFDEILEDVVSNKSVYFISTDKNVVVLMPYNSDFV